MSSMHILDSTPPSTFLPPLARLRATSTEDIASALGHIRQLYWPETCSKAPLPPHFTIPVRHISTLIHDTTVPDSGYASGNEDEGRLEDEVLLDEDDDALEALRADTFERSFVLRWLTGLIARGDAWSGTIDEEGRLEAIDEASSILSAFTGAEEEAEVAVTRELTFTSTGGASVSVELNDAPLSTSDHTSVGLQSWASSIVLAERMCSNPSHFGLGTSSRIIELGAGTGLLSIVAAKLSRTSTVVATDYHPDVLANCQANVRTNAAGSAPIAVKRLDWQCPEYDDELAMPFDTVLAADVIYHPEHARWLKGCVEKTMRPGGVFWLMIPVRATGRHEGMYRTVEEVFAPGALGLVVLEEEHVMRRDGVGRADESPNHQGRDSTALYTFQHNTSPESCPTRWFQRLQQSTSMSVTSCIDNYFYLEVVLGRPGGANRTIDQNRAHTLVSFFVRTTIRTSESIRCSSTSIPECGKIQQ